MLTFGRRAIEFAVLVLALYALAVVPLGRRTGLEHLRAILRTKAAQDAGHELVQAAERLGHRLAGGDATAAPRARPDVPTPPRRSPGNAAFAADSFEGPDAGVGAR